MSDGFTCESHASCSHFSKRCLMWGGSLQHMRRREQKGAMEEKHLQSFKDKKPLMHIESMDATLSRWKTLQSPCSSLSLFIQCLKYCFQAFRCVFIALWRFTFTDAHLGSSGGYITAAGGEVPCSRVLDGFQRERRKWHSNLSHARFLNWTGTHVLTDSHLSPSRDSYFSRTLISKLITAVLK